MTRPIVAVRGEAVLEVPPERASFSLALVVRDRDRTDALQQLQRRAAELEAVLDGFGPAVEGRGTDAVRVSPVYKDGKLGDKDKIVAYQAATRTTVHVGDLAVVGDVVSRLANLGLVDLAGPWWALRPESPVYREVRTAAVSDALRRAQEYAEALGTHLEGLVELADTGLLSSQAPDRGPGPGPATMMFARAGGAGPAPEIDLEPVRQTVHAAVEARFTVRPPDLGSG